MDFPTTRSKPMSTTVNSLRARSGRVGGFRDEMSEDFATAIERDLADQLCEPAKRMLAIGRRHAPSESNTHT